MDSQITLLGIIGIVILVAALVSGAVERSRFPQILIFLVLGTAVGPFGLGVMDLPLQSETIRVVSTVGLVLVLFTDAVGVSFVELRRHATLAAIILGPGTLVVAAITALAAHYLLDLGLAASAILGAALASTDPVILRGLLRHPSVPEPARTALRLESGMNDAVLLPVVLVAMALVAPAAGAHAADPWARVLVDIVVLGGGAGVLVGLLAVGALDLIRRRIGIRRDYESLYVLAVALTSFAAAEAVGGSGFIAAFTGGLVIAALDIELCECFYDYGEATAEMALLFTFVALGSSAIWSALDVLSPQTFAFAAVALFTRPLVLLAALAPTRLDARSRRYTLWFGPRGLSSLLLVLLPVFAGVPGSERLFAVTSLVVLLSVFIHGGSQMLLRAAPDAPPGADAGPPGTAALRAPRRQASAAADRHVASRDRITLDEVRDLQAAGEDVLLLDVRTESALAAGGPAPGALRVPPDRARETVAALRPGPEAWLVAFCA